MSYVNVLIICLLLFILTFAMSVIGSVTSVNVISYDFTHENRKDYLGFYGDLINELYIFVASFSVLYFAIKFDFFSSLANILMYILFGFCCLQMLSFIVALVCQIKMSIDEYRAGNNMFRILFLFIMLFIAQMIVFTSFILILVNFLFYR